MFVTFHLITILINISLIQVISTNDFDLTLTKIKEDKSINNCT